MARSIKKGPFVDKHLAKKVEEMIKGNKKQVERERSKIYVGPDSDQPNLAHWIVRLEPPMECQAKAMRRR